MRKYIIFFVLNIFFIPLGLSQAVDFSMWWTEGCDSLTNIAQGCDSLEVRFRNATPGTYTFKWDFGDPAVGNDSLRKVPNPTVKFYPGKYSVTLSAFRGGIPYGNKTKTVDVHISPVARLKDTSITKEYYRRYFIEQSILDPRSTTDTGFHYSFKFDFGDNDTYTGTKKRALYPHLYMDKGNFKVTMIVSDKFSCADTASINITISDSSNLIIPNVFTPNNDSINDLFIVRSNGVTNLTLQVFNRDGVKIFENTAATIMWDGKTISGMDAPTGIYIVVITSEQNKYPVKKQALYLFR